MCLDFSPLCVSPPRPSVSMASPARTDSCAFKSVAASYSTSFVSLNSLYSPISATRCNTKLQPLQNLLRDAETDRTRRPLILLAEEETIKITHILQFPLSPSIFLISIATSRRHNPPPLCVEDPVACPDDRCNPCPTHVLVSKFSPGAINIWSRGECLEIVTSLREQRAPLVCALHNGYLNVNAHSSGMMPKQ